MIRVVREEGRCIGESSRYKRWFLGLLRQLGFVLEISAIEGCDMDLRQVLERGAFGLFLLVRL